MVSTDDPSRQRRQPLCMFILTRLTDTVKLLPSTEYTHSALTLWLNTKYSNRVLHKTGLCISVYDILSVGDGALKYGDGCVYIKSTHPGDSEQC